MISNPNSVHFIKIKLATILELGLKFGPPIYISKFLYIDMILLVAQLYGLRQLKMWLRVDEGYSILFKSLCMTQSFQIVTFPN